MLSHIARLFVFSIGGLSLTAVASNAEMIHLMARKGDTEAVRAEIERASERTKRTSPCCQPRSLIDREIRIWAEASKAPRTQKFHLTSEIAGGTAERE